MYCRRYLARVSSKGTVQWVDMTMKMLRKFVTVSWDESRIFTLKLANGSFISAKHYV